MNVIKIMKIIVLVLLLLTLVFSNVSSLKINEVELNPDGKDKNKEWIEIYENERVDLRGYEFKNNDGKKIIIDKIMNNEYYIYYFNGQWLDNSNEKISIYKDNELIFETEILNDKYNDNRTWNYCNGEWQFEESTKNYENNCNQNLDIVNKSKIKLENSSKTKTISLNPQTIKTLNNKENLNKRKFYATYGLMLFCILLFILFGLKSLNKIKKNGIV